MEKTVLQVDGITCLDCAQKFEQEVRRLPGVSGATLNALTGKLTVEGRVDVDAIRRLGRAENYVVNPPTPAAPAAQQPQSDAWAKRRTLISGASLLLAYGVEQTGGVPLAFLPLYVLAMAAGGWGNLQKAARALPRLNFNMSVLMSVALLGAVGIGQYEEGATIAFLYSVSELLEAWTMEKARRSIHELMDIAPKSARVRRAGSETIIPVEEIGIGDLMIIAPGAKIAMDGVIVRGESAVNQAAINGESLPAEKRPGDEVFAGTLNTYGALEVRVTKLVQDTTIAKIIHMVEEAQGRRAPSQAFVERFAAVYTPVVMALAIGVIFVPPLILGEAWRPWLYRGLTLLLVSCPCALVISTPVALVSAISNAARNGVLIKGGLYLEAVGALQAIAFDKTGTLTQGKPVVTDVVRVGALDEARLLALAADLEVRSDHPLAAAIVEAARGQGHQAQPATQVAAIAGRGAQGVIDGQRFYIGNPQLFHELGVSLGGAADAVAALQAHGKTVMLVGTSAALYGLIAVADEVRANSRAAVTALKRAGIQHTIMLTGDNAATARAIAAQAGVDEYRFDLLPEDKLAAVQALLTQYGKVAMVGDGINDAPALALSTVGIAMGGAGTDTALETADIALMGDDLSKLPFAVRLSRKALGVIRQNITFSLLIKAIAILAVFPGWLTLWLAILADTGATILVTLNSLRLLRVKAVEQAPADARTAG